jgi:hypothetical protein
MIVPSPYEEHQNLEPDRKRARLENYDHISDDFSPGMAEWESSSAKDTSHSKSSNSIIISNVPQTATSKTVQDFVESSLRKYRVRVVGCHTELRGACHRVKLDLETKYQARMALNLNFVVWEDRTIYVKPWNPLVFQSI